ncbi:hypothetical protein A8C32_03705 [Flavivirga aquatica]|uniref:Uncharacterized protein n=1 Tax=Flavivirga aquatica TaxID=1849968 RepID=A0A1E5TB43_9FLAO|nr:hypothetical protein A8C32_03705 [Flavivirga aquatica]
MIVYIYNHINQIIKKKKNEKVKLRNNKIIFFINNKGIPYDENGVTLSISKRVASKNDSIILKFSNDFIEIIEKEILVLNLKVMRLFQIKILNIRNY